MAKKEVKFSPLTYDLMRRQEDIPDLMNAVACLVKNTRAEVTNIMLAADKDIDVFANYPSMIKLAKDTDQRRMLAREAIKYVKVARLLG